MSSRVVTFVDGDNLPSVYATKITEISKALGTVLLSRVYGNETTLRSWAGCHPFEFVFSGNGKNGADLHLAVDLIEFTMTRDVDVVLLCTSDADFAHLARKLRASGITVIGLGEPKANNTFRSSVTEFYSMAQYVARPCEKAEPVKTSALDQQILSVIANNSMNGRGIRLHRLATTMYSKHGTRISQEKEGTWRAYLAKRPALFDLDPRGPEAMVRTVSTSANRAASLP